MKCLSAVRVTVALILAAMISAPALARSGHGGAGGAHFSGSHGGGAQLGGSRPGGNRASGGSFAGGNFNRGRVAGGHFHGRIGVVVGAPLFLPSWYFYPPPPPWYYYPEIPPAYYYDEATAFAGPVAPPVHSQQDPAPAPYQDPGPATSAQQPYYWYYCAESKSYYPYVNECAGGWQTQTPHAPSSPAAPSAN